MKLPQPRRYKSDKMKFEDMIQEGENPKGFTGQTANGTVHCYGTGWNQRTYDFEMPQNDPSAVAPAGRNNRTGE